jgi:hypothetical protein
VGAGEGDVAASGGAGEQDTLECRGAQDAAMQAGEDDRQIDGAETRSDGGEAGRRGAERDGVGEMAAIGEQDANDMEECADALGRGGRILGGDCFTFHGSLANRMQSLWQCFSRPSAFVPDTVGFAAAKNRA